VRGCVCGCVSACAVAVLAAFTPQLESPLSRSTNTPTTTCIAIPNHTHKQIVYVAPMKALAAEVTANFGKRLAALGLVVKELTGAVGGVCVWVGGGCAGGCCALRTSPCGF
jgi:hypothetical protein